MTCVYTCVVHNLCSISTTCEISVGRDPREWVGCWRSVMRKSFLENPLLHVCLSLTFGFYLLCSATRLATTSKTWKHGLAFVGTYPCTTHTPVYRVFFSSSLKKNLFWQPECRQELWDNEQCNDVKKEKKKEGWWVAIIGM